MFSSFANVHKLLSDAEQKISTKKGILDSHLISAAFLKNSNFGAKIVFKHLTETTADRICVYWDFTEENWSDFGCTTLKSNESHTVCQCENLGHFAILAQVEDPEFVGQNLDFGLIQTKEAQKTSENTVITLEIATYLVSSVCFLILVILLVQVSPKKKYFTIFSKVKQKIIFVSLT